MINAAQADDCKSTLGIIVVLQAECLKVTIVTRHTWAGAAARLGKMLPTRRISAPTAFNFSSMFS
jgi:hypothetical protein